MTNRDYAALNALERDAVYRDLADLAERGLVEVSGTGAGTTYRVMRGAISAPPPRTPIERLVARTAEAGYVTNTDIRDIFGVDRDRAKLMLWRWVAEGTLVREGEKRGARYRPGDRWPPQ